MIKICLIILSAPFQSPEDRFSFENHPRRLMGQSNVIIFLIIFTRWSGGMLKSSAWILLRIDIFDSKLTNLTSFLLKIVILDLPFILFLYLRSCTLFYALKFSSILLDLIMRIIFLIYLKNDKQINSQTRKLLSMIATFINVINIFGWITVLYFIVSKFFTNSFSLSKVDISSQVALVSLIQGFQILDIVMVLIGKSKGSLFGSIAQITGRLVVAWYFIEPETNKNSFAAMVTMWAIADSVRYSYYLTKNEIIAFLRYNLFLILYPTGVYFQMRVINDYIKRHAQTLQVSDITIIRVVQAGIIIGTVFLYAYMLKMRSKNRSKMYKETFTGESKKQ